MKGCVKQQMYHIMGSRDSEYKLFYQNIASKDFSRNFIFCGQYSGATLPCNCKLQKLFRQNEVHGCRKNVQQIYGRMIHNTEEEKQARYEP